MAGQNVSPKYFRMGSAVTFRHESGLVLHGYVVLASPIAPNALVRVRGRMPTSYWVAQDELDAEVTS